MSMGKFENPACKLEVGDSEFIQNFESFWVYNDGQCKFRINLLWLQGTVSSIATDRDEIELRDGNEIVHICNCLKIPGGSDWLAVGQYVMVIGDLVVRPEPNVLKVKAIKISDLSTNVSLKQLWPFEVKEAKRLYEKICKY